jgi:GNAT superfamily N-acetyltransferase
MKPNAMVRPIQPEELAEAKRVYYQVVYEFMPPAQTLEEMIALSDAWEGMNDLKDVQAQYVEMGGAFLVALLDGRLVGTGGFRRYEVVGYCELKRIALLPHARGQGLGYALIHDLIQRARAMGYARMILWTNRYVLTRAVDIYRRIGFVEVEHPGADEEDIWMELDLSAPDLA